MTAKQAIKFLRGVLGERGEHHPGCDIRLYPRGQAECDCYAKEREDAHQALDVLERELSQKKGKVAP